MATQCIRLKNPAIPWCFSTGGPSVVEVFIYFFVHSNCFLPHHSALPEMRSIQQFFISDKLFLKSRHSSRPTGRDLLYLYDIKTLRTLRIIIYSAMRFLCMKVRAFFPTKMHQYITLVRRQSLLEFSIH